MRRHKPVAVMLNYHNYESLEKVLDYVEDYILGCVALQRDKTTKTRDFVDIREW